MRSHLLALSLVLAPLAADAAEGGGSSAASSGAPLRLLGGDLSAVPFLEQRGVVYRDRGAAKDPLDLLAGRGLNLVRLRLWTGSDADVAKDPFARCCTLSYVLPLAQRVKRSGMKLLLDLHYSDSWADPAKQHKPAAWEGLDFPDLTQRLHEYNREVLQTFIAAGAAPDYIQLGNEITQGMLWPDGKLSTPGSWDRFEALYRAADAGMRAGAGDHVPRTIVHIDRGSDWGVVQWFFDEFQTKRRIGFDIIGVSYYPFWNGDLAKLEDSLSQTAERFAKPVLIAETAFPWNTTTWEGKPEAAVAGIAAGPVGQVEFTAGLGRILDRLPAGRGLGICWWGAELVAAPGVHAGGFDQRSFFNAQGEALPVVDALAGLRAAAGAGSK